MWGRVVALASCFLASVQAQASPFTPVIVYCSTTKGDVYFKIHPEWSPNGADRFLDLVERGHFDESAFYRVVPGFVTQFGINSNPEKSTQVQNEGTLQDDPYLGIAWRRGMLSFAGSGSKTRSSEMFIGTSDSLTLGLQPWETPIGYVVSGMDVVDRLYSGYGDLELFGNGGTAPDPRKIKAKGNEFLQLDYPQMDYISRCTIESQRVRYVTPPMIPRASPKPRPVPTPPPTSERKPVPTPPPSSEAPKMRNVECNVEACGKSYPDASGEGILCSCQWECVFNKNCCVGFGDNCPAQLAQADEELAKAEAARTKAAAPVTYKCKAEVCGGALALDAESDIICSCHYNCVLDGNCCVGFQETCPEQYELGTKTLPVVSTQFATAGKRGKGKGKTKGKGKGKGKANRNRSTETND